MPTIVTRAGKGSALTWAEGDANINNLNTAIDNIVAGTQAVGLATNADNIDIATIDGNTSDTAMSVVLVANQATGNQAPHIDAGLTYNASTNALTATTFVGALSGNAATATGATNININSTSGNGGDTSMNVVLVGAASTGNQLPHIDAGLTYNASTNALTATEFVGDLTGNADTATSATNINISTTSGNSSDTSMNVVLVATQNTGNQAPHIDAGLTYNASTNALTATTFVGTLTGTATNVTGTVAIANGGTGQTTAPAASAALNGFTSTATAAGTTTLTNTSSVYQLFTGTTTQTVQLPSTATLATGWSFHIVNNSTGNLTLNTSTAVNLGTIVPGTTVMATVISIADNTAAAWEFGFTDFSTVTGTGAVVLATSPTLTTPALGTPSSGNLANCTFPTLNQNTTGTAANVTGVVAVANGGTGTATPSIVAGTNITVSGTWPNQTINASGGSSGITDLVQDTTPQLGGNLDLNNFHITNNGTNESIVLQPTIHAALTELRSSFITLGDTGRTTVVGMYTAGNRALRLSTFENTGGQILIGRVDENISITPNGIGQTVIKNLEYNENIFALGTTSGTIAPDVANGNVQTITLNGNLTLNAFTSPIAGQSLTLIILTNGTGRTLTSTMLFAGGSKTLSTTNTRDIISVFFDGTTYYASLAKGFA